MANPHGTPIWYELQTPDPDAAKTFYDAVIGWTIEPRPAGPMDYRMIDTGDGMVGGVARYTPGMMPAQMQPGWKVYVGVDDVDSSAATITQAGGAVLMPAFDLPGIGRMAFVADPQGIMFYIMRGATEGGTSTAWDRTGMGKCNWNELNTSDQAGAHDFYSRVFRWSYPDRIPMGELGDYIFVHVGAEAIGATMTTRPGGPPPGWVFYFRAPDIEAAAEQVRASGGVVHHGPVDVPGGDRIILATDPMGAIFGVVGPGEPSAQQGA